MHLPQECFFLSFFWGGGMKHLGYVFYVSRFKLEQVNKIAHSAQEIAILKPKSSNYIKVLTLV